MSILSVRPAGRIAPPVIPALVGLVLAAAAAGADGPAWPCYSGIYPHLAMFNSGGECGVGALACWADRLWVITYPPHEPATSDDKLYAIDRQLHRIALPQSLGGTAANRMIHRPSGQLFIGRYVIDRQANVRLIAPDRAFGRLTATAAHLADPDNKVYLLTMEQGLYEVDVHSLAVKELHVDGNVTDRRGHAPPAGLPARHGKAGYTGQGRLLYGLNGRAPARGQATHRPDSCLAQWDGHRWQVVQPHPFVEVTGPGGIAGNDQPNQPVWAVGWDDKSVLLAVLSDGRWATYRLPKASLTYDAPHGWYTEWPRIRPTGFGFVMMNMHGMFWRFPATFTPHHSAGIAPMSSYLKIVSDWERFGDRLVLACNDAAITGGNRLCGQSQSNLWFVRPNQLEHLGPRLAWGGLWRDQPLQPGQLSLPFLVGPFHQTTLHLWHDSPLPVHFDVEIDPNGQGRWQNLQTLTVRPGQYLHLDLDSPAPWLRLRCDRACRATAWLALSCPDDRPVEPAPQWANLAGPLPRSCTVGLIQPRPRNRKTLHLAAWHLDRQGRPTELGYYELGADMRLVKRDNEPAGEQLKQQARLKIDYSVDDRSVVLTDRQGRRWRLPKSHPAFDQPTALGRPRGVREVVTERFLLNAHGSLYELPRDDARSVAGIKPIATHNRLLWDFCSYRGMLVLTGLTHPARPDPHTLLSDDGRLALWLGTIDDLWTLGRPRGYGWIWNHSPVRPDSPSDPFLMLNYTHRTVHLTNHGPQPVTFTIQVDPTSYGQWVNYRQVHLPPGHSHQFQFEPGYNAHWLRVVSDRQTVATVELDYR